MAITRQKYEEIKAHLGSHTSWAVWAPVGDKPKSNVGDLSVFNDEDKIPLTLSKLNPEIVLAGLNGSTGESVEEIGVEPFGNFHSGWYRATDFKIRYATVGTALEGAFMTDVIKHHYETDSVKVKESLRRDPDYERVKVEEFFREITLHAQSPTIFAFGGLAHKLITKYNNGRFRVFRLYHYAFTMSKERFREETLKVLEGARFE